MSRIGKKLIYLPDGVTAQIDGKMVSVKGPKGEISREMHPVVSVEQKQDEDGKTYLQVTVPDKAEDSAIWGTFRAHLANMVAGVKDGWTKALELNGVGFRMNVQGNKIVMSLGFSHEVVFPLPEGMTATAENNVLTLTSVNKELVGKIAAEIRALKKPEPYKGKGFRYTDETIRRKAGKAAKSD